LYKTVYFDADWSPNGIKGFHEITGAQAGDALYSIPTQLGCRVVLTGQMGDSLNDGYEWNYFGLLRSGKYRELLRHLQMDWKRSRTRTLLGLLFYGLAPMAPMPLLRAALMARERQRGMFCEVPAFFPVSLRKHIGEVDEAIRMRCVRETH